MKSVRPKKFLGQHFLKDLPTAQAIADTVDAAPGLPILEVGPGMGVLTQYLLKKGRELKVVKIDFESVAFLLKAFPELGDGLLEEDFLQMQLDRTFGGREFVLTGWLAGFGPDAKLLEPGDVRLQFARFLQKTLEQYEKDE